MLLTHCFKVMDMTTADRTTERSINVTIFVFAISALFRVRFFVMVPNVVSTEGQRTHLLSNKDKQGWYKNKHSLE